MHDVLSVILGGGRGNRLFPLTKYRSKPAVPIAGKYRLVDVPISNCLNSGLNRVYVITQFHSQSLNKHITRAYQLDQFSRGFVAIIAAEQTLSESGWFQGTADAVRQSARHWAAEFGVNEVLILSGDHLYSMDFRELIRTHREQKNDVTICCQPVQPSEAHRFGLIRTDANDQVIGFAEKPKQPDVVKSFTNREGTCLASMGIYVFKRQLLIDLLNEGDESDFGHDVLPKAVGRVRVGVHRYRGYWEDIGTIKTFYDANLALTHTTSPIDLFSQEWPIFTHARYLPPAVVQDGMLHDSLVVDGCHIYDSTIKNSIIGVRGIVREGCRIENTVFFGADYYAHDKEDRAALPPRPLLGIGRNCIIRNAIIDKNARIGEGTKIVNERGTMEADGDGYAIREGIVVVEKNAVIAPGTVI